MLVTFIYETIHAYKQNRRKTRPCNSLRRVNRTQRVPHCFGLESRMGRGGVEGNFFLSSPTEGEVGEEEERGD